MIEQSHFYERSLKAGTAEQREAALGRERFELEITEIFLAAKLKGVRKRLGELSEVLPQDGRPDRHIDEINDRDREMAYKRITLSEIYKHLEQ